MNMKEMNMKESIELTKQGFEDSFRTGVFYNKQTQDKTHLQQIMNSLEIRPGMRILDLGTGMGFLAFPIAETNPDAIIVGLDIVETALICNRQKAQEEQLDNLSFVSYDGVHFPFEDGSFDLVITRYALHHFPDIQDTFAEIARVLKEQGQFFLSDPTPNREDTDGFVDAYMQMKKDGHIKFYTCHEWQQLGSAVGLLYQSDFETDIRFPKKRETAVGFEEILTKYKREVIDGYHLEVTEDEIWITERVNNITFRKK